jgi:hypothetical protein
MPLRAPQGAEYVEIWNSQKAPDDGGQDYSVRVRLGKPLDILALKLNTIEEFQSHVLRAKSEAVDWYGRADLVTVSQCPICGSARIDPAPSLEVYSVEFRRCLDCDHFMVSRRPSAEFIEEFYTADSTYATVYRDKRTSETRVQQVSAPKAKWVVEQFSALYGRKPRSLLDVGAGGGHFVRACRGLGIKARGIEINQLASEFCRTQFGFELEKADFIKDWRAFAPVDVITFWGVIEHVVEPLEFLKAAQSAVAQEEALVVAEVPRWDCFSTAVQTSFPDSVFRHLNPVGHIHVFSDTSLAAAFESCGLGPVAAWYFGLDAFELTSQIAYHLGKLEVLETLGRHLPILQSMIDRGRLSDEMVLAGRPLGGKSLN